MHLFIHVHAFGEIYISRLLNWLKTKKLSRWLWETQTIIQVWDIVKLLKNTIIILMCPKVCENNRIIWNACSYLYLVWDLVPLSFLEASKYNCWNVNFFGALSFDTDSSLGTSGVILVPPYSTKTICLWKDKNMKEVSWVVSFITFK